MGRRTIVVPARRHSRTQLKSMNMNLREDFEQWADKNEAWPWGWWRMAAYDGWIGRDPEVKALRDALERLSAQCDRLRLSGQSMTAAERNAIAVLAETASAPIPN